MDETAAWTTIAAERRALADLLDGLGPEQWASPSLCAGWTVRHVAAHLMAGPTGSWTGFLRAMVRARGSFDRANRQPRAVATLVADPWADALDLLVRKKAAPAFLPHGLPRLTYAATDIDWSHGPGPRVEGPAEALALAVTRRPVRLDQLTGPGSDEPRTWASG